MLAKLLDKAREDGMSETASRFAEEWNDNALAIIALEKAMRKKGILPPCA